MIALNALQLAEVTAAYLKYFPVVDLFAHPFTFSFFLFLMIVICWISSSIRPRKNIRIAHSNPLRGTVEGERQIAKCKATRAK